DCMWYSVCGIVWFFYFFFQAEDGIRDFHVTGVQTCALPIFHRARWRPSGEFEPACTIIQLVPEPAHKKLRFGVRELPIDVYIFRYAAVFATLNCSPSR